MLCEVILSDDVLARLLLNGGACDPNASQENEQASRALLVFVQMVIIDRGVE
jgi:hypothetical protein